MAKERTPIQEFSFRNRSSGWEVTAACMPSDRRKGRVSSSQTAVLIVVFLVMTRFRRIQHYGVHQGPMFAPISEELTPRWDDGTNFYHPQEDFMFALQKQRQWSYNIIRPQAIIGFTPGRKWSYNTNDTYFPLLFSR